MFMYTWPDIKTLNTGIYGKDVFTFNESESLSASVRLGFDQNRIAKETGLESLQIFYPEINDSKNRVWSSFNADYQSKKEHFNFSFGTGYGERAPSVSEGYGFFLFNSFDNYDYIGESTLNNEKAFKVNAQANYQKDKFHLGLETSYFHIMEHILEPFMRL